MKIKLIASLLLLLPFLSKAQDAGTPDAFAETLITLDAGFTGVQAGAEFSISKQSTVQFRGGLIPVLYNPTEYYGTEAAKWVAGLTASAEYRHYYNFARRVERGKKITNNGANYVGLLVLYLTKPLGKNKDLPYATSAVLTGPMWGFNRPLGNRVFFTLDLGPVLQHEISNRNSAVTLYGDARFSVRFN